ncbi:O-antigen/teichoic acid export membrane protein [Winogradskyella wandonensis]|uniref:O-antigen/teichoic acid export membrane protein n=1 Tax=Winogradskyella wandonensis TaxID=1442586 RepID=A0A4R1KS10_9FLAO|nr:oligosaccharide flippase family protein [Winogradskyella wandonensis]TCK67812.1 O-antigen/teichoic acid export membrane protein [Winogradskyella wandonensis]
MNLKYYVSSIGLSFFAKAIGLINIMLIIPLLVNNYSADEFGIYILLTQLITIFGVLDFGLGSVLINEILFFRNSKQFGKIKEIIIQSFSFLLIVSLVLTLLTVFILFILKEPKSYDFLPDIIKSAKNLDLFKISVVFFLILPFTLIQKIQFGFLDNAVFHFVEVIQKIIQGVGIFIMAKNTYNIFDIVFFYYSVILLTDMLNGIIYFFFIKKPILQSTKFTRQNLLPPLFKKSFYFFLVSLFFFFSNTIDTYLISGFGNFQMLKDYDIIKRPYEICMVGIMIIISVLWPVFGEAYQKKQVSKIKMIVRRSLLTVTTGLLLLSLTMFFFGNEIISLWINQTKEYKVYLFLIVGLMYLMFSLGNVFIAYLNSANSISVQVIIYSVMTFIGVPFKIFFIKSYGLDGYFIASSIILAFLFAIPLYYQYSKKVKKAKLESDT